MGERRVGLQTECISKCKREIGSMQKREMYEWGKKGIENLWEYVETGGKLDDPRCLKRQDCRKDGGVLIKNREKTLSEQKKRILEG